MAAGGGSIWSGTWSCGIGDIGLWCEDSSVKGIIRIGVVICERTSGDGADHRPGRGSELLRRLPACHDSSSSATGERIVDWWTREGSNEGPAWSVDCACCCCCALTESNEERDDRRERRILGRRARFEPPRARSFIGGGLQEEAGSGD